MRRLVPFFIFITLTACQSTDGLDYSEKRLVGSWFYTDVDYNPKWGFKKDVTKDFFGQIISFNSDFTLTVEDSQSSALYQGVWQLEPVTQAAAAGNSTSGYDQLIASYENTTTGQIVQLVWDNVCIYRNRIQASNSTDEGFYQYELKRM